MIFYIKLIGLDIKRLYINILKISETAIVPILIGLLGIQFEDLKIYFVWAVLYTAVFALFMWRFGINKEEKELVKRPFKKFGIFWGGRFYE